MALLILFPCVRYGALGGIIFLVYKKGFKLFNDTTIINNFIKTYHQKILKIKYIHLNIFESPWL